MSRIPAAAPMIMISFLLLAHEARAEDKRDNFDATFYTGASIDSFAAQDLNRYLNPGESASKKLGYIAGLDFSYRAIGNKESSKPQLWIYGETVHGQRSAEVDCEKSDQQTLPAQCTLLKDFVPSDTAFLGILRNASSLEGFTGVRLELLTLHAGDSAHGKLYLKSELGFFSIAGSGQDVFDSHQKLALGLLAIDGKFRDSFMEVGWGRSDIFSDRRGRRFKVDGYLTWDLGKDENSWMRRYGMKPFIEMTVDSDLGSGADSIRTFYGFNFAIDKLFDPAKKQP